MYYVLIGVQLLAIFFSIFSTILLIRLQSSIENRYLFICAVCIDIYAVGYLQEMLFHTEEGVRTALSFEYCGLAFAALAYVLFIFKYCNVKELPRWLSYCLFGFCIFVMFTVQLGSMTDLYYSSFEIAYDGVFPHASTGKTPLYYAFAIFQAVLISNGAIVIFLRRKRTQNPNEKRKLTILFAESIMPLIGLVCTVTLNLGGWDPSPLILSILVTTVSLTLRGGQFYDTVSFAMQNLFQNVGSAVIIADISKNYLSGNKASERVFPELRNWRLGHRLSDLGVDLFADSNNSDFERNGRYYKTSFTKLIERGRHIGYTIVITDNTDDKVAVESMRHLMEAADAANEAKSTFLANMSHEIRTPLNAIIGMSELSEREVSESVIREYNGQIKAAGKMLLEIVNDVLDFSKAESNKLELVPVEFDTADFLEGIINVVNSRIGDKPIDFLVDIDPGIPKTLYGDDVHIRQIIMNLLSNAEKFTNTGHIKFTLDYERDNITVKLKGSVEDTGIGIREEDRKKLFTAFQQLDGKKNRRTEGSGLGLAIFAQLVTLMKGTYRLESEYGKGSTFFFEIELGAINPAPFANSERECINVKKLPAFSLYKTKTDKNEAGAKSDKPAVMSDYSAYNILVVDDNKVNVKVLSAFLKHFKVQADAALSGAEAIEMVKNKKYDLIFMDHMMPDMDGVETTRRIRSLDDRYYHNAPIIACTANVVKGVEEIFIEAGMNDFVPKPIQLEVLQEKMARFLK
ncbi:MAG: response regulator [Lachnospiraceae bacterium]|nr:response regulator [Lachnospiraceae bacterium]